MKNGSSQNSEQVMLDQLRSILLSDDREVLRRLENLLNDRTQLSEKISPIMEDHLAHMRQNFPNEYKLVVDKLIQERILHSQDEIVEAIYPVLGSMVRKYIEHQFQLLKESIEERIREMQRRLNFWQRLKLRWAGVSEGELLLAATNIPQVVEIYLVERNSGLLLAHAAQHENLDKEAVAGMLTAIKAFVEDAFRREKEELDYIAYDHYKIIIENYRSYYLAAMVEGSVSASERDLLSEKLRQFIHREYNYFNQKNDEAASQHISGLLLSTFIHQNGQS